MRTSPMLIRDIKSTILPIDFYRAELSVMPTPRGSGWRDGGLCPFHNDKRADNFRMNLESVLLCAFQVGAAVMNNNVKLWPKRYPSYGRRLEKIRQDGLIPNNRVIVSTRWELGAAYPRIVISDDTPVANLNFSYLAGLSVQIVHCNNEAQLVIDLIDAIVEVNPAVLTIFNYELAKNNLSDHPAMRFIHPELVEAA
jgi:hypothetical protein